MNYRHFLAGMVLLGSLAGIAGCQSGGTDGVLGLGGKKEPEAVPEGKILASELLAYCPKLIVRQSEGFINRYAKGGEGDDAKLSYQASISDSTRSCSRQTGMLAMQVALAGRVVPGPANTGGTVTLPIRIRVVQAGGAEIYNQVFTQQVTLGPQVQQFVFKDANIVIPIPTDNSLQLLAGFDQGPEKKKKQEEELF